jgi:phosphate:Na+ symporter
LEYQTTATHFDRLRNGRLESVETSSLHLDALRDLKRVNAAYPVLEGFGELLSSRLRSDDFSVSPDGAEGL